MPPIELLNALVEKYSGYAWAPGPWGKRLSSHAGWSATLDGPTLRVNSTDFPVDSITAVRLRRGLIWSTILIEVLNHRGLLLGGLTNRNGAAFAGLLKSACTLNAFHRLEALIPEAERQRDRWERLLAEPRWIAQSDVTGFLLSASATSDSDAIRTFLNTDFAITARQYMSPEQTGVLRYLFPDETLYRSDARNRRFLYQEAARFAKFFDTVEKNPLTDEQREAVVTFDDNVMTVAAAGSGKTSVLVAKAGYAVAAGLFKPDEILLLAFNRKAAAELAERVSARLGPRIPGANRIKVATFHSLGLDVIGAATGRKPTVAAWIEQSNELAELIDITRHLSRSRDFAAKWNLFKNVFAQSLPPFGAEEEPEWWDKETGARGFLTLRGETVKSQEERMICDWLAQEGVDYVYERPYEHDTATATHRQYYPDFYYPSANVYHEHFALDENGVPPRHFTGYADGVEWKRALHAEMGTTLIETTSFGIRTLGGFERLRADLDAVDVPFGETALTEEQLARDSDEASLLRVFRTFMAHVKSNQLTMADLRARAVSRKSEQPGRDQLFLDIFEALWGEWDRRLADAGALDFEDMLVQATDYLASGRCTMPYRLVMADEFQDSSRVRGAMLRELTRAEDARLYVVGDDWQAVNRFAGADISLMQNFDRHIGPYSLTQLTKTFRCPADICEVASTFVTRNPYQIDKHVRTVNDRPPPNILCFQLENFDTQDALLRSHLRKLAQKTRDAWEGARVTAYVLGRYQTDKPSNFDGMASEIAETVDLRWSTIHASKGLEADYVFLVNVVEGTKGMPSKIEDDSTLWIAMPDGENYPHAEERRLFYVALTRAKRMVSIYTDAYRRSEFIAELEQLEPGVEVRYIGGTGEKKRGCVRCRTGILVTRNGPYGEFLSCSRFPKCDYKENIRRECPKCKDGVLVVKEGKYGRFYSCSRFPRCDFRKGLNKGSRVQ